MRHRFYESSQLFVLSAFAYASIWWCVFGIYWRWDAIKECLAVTMVMRMGNQMRFLLIMATAHLFIHRKSQNSKDLPCNFLDMKFWIQDVGKMKNYRRFLRTTGSCASQRWRRGTRFSNHLSIRTGFKSGPASSNQKWPYAKITICRFCAQRSSKFGL